jgi:hypothetical protein
VELKFPGRIPVPVPSAVQLQTRGLPPALPPGELVIEHVPAWKTATAVEPGDFVLSRAHGVRHKIIKWGQGLRITDPADRCYRDYTHAAVVVSPNGDIIEAVGSGVRRANLSEYVPTTYEVVHITASAEDRAQIVAVAEEALGRKARYNALATVSITLWAFTGSRLIFFTDGAFTCSGLVARAMLAIGAVFSVDATRVTPAQLAIYFNAPRPREEPRPPRPTLRARLVAPWAARRARRRAGSAAPPPAPPPR